MWRRKLLVLAVIVGLGGVGWLVRQNNPEWLAAFMSTEGDADSVAAIRESEAVNQALSAAEAQLNTSGTFWADQVLRHNATRAYDAGLREMAMGRHEEAARQFERSIAIDPNFADGHYRLGLAWARVGEIEQARQEWDTLAGLDPSLANLLANLLP